MHVMNSSESQPHLERLASECGARLLLAGHSDYPDALNCLEENKPLALFARGSLEILSQPCVAIVGTRTCTRYGERIATELAAELASAGACIVSGMARGIDSAAHRGALSVSGKTCAVLGTGIDLVYPATNASLQKEIAENGLLLTEMLPGEKPHGGSFPKRNRIIAALASLTIVVEAGRKTGARHTWEAANRLNKTVAAVPGPIDSMTSYSTNELLRDGAQFIMEIEDALSLAGLSRKRRPRGQRELSHTESAIVRALAGKTLTTEQLIIECALPVSECLAAVSALEVDGFIEANLVGEFRLLFNSPVGAALTE